MLVQTAPASFAVDRCVVNPELPHLEMQCPTVCESAFKSSGSQPKTPALIACTAKRCFTTIPLKKSAVATHDIH